MGDEETGGRGEGVALSEVEVETGRCVLPFTSYLLPLTHYPLPITSYPLPITHYPLPITSVVPDAGGRLARG
jgi:hypothetical protein